ncbi:molybdenum cofactor guanylyltransferase [Planotetraspora silvatica]|nr:molybdenum cofactor guanylyltransferase [Planotetraspora silvatica]
MSTTPEGGPGIRGGVTPYDAVILAGGRAERLGGLDKPGALVGGRSLIERVASAVGEATRLIVVGPPRDLAHEPSRTADRSQAEEGAGVRAASHEGPEAVDGVVFTSEDPPGGGPVPALRAGLAQVRAPWLALLAADLPFLSAHHITALFLAARAGEITAAAGAVLVDDDGREQWLTGVWRTEALADALDGYRGRSLYRLLGPLEPVRVHLPAPGDGRAPWFDCDTMDDLGAARERARGA